MYSILQLQILKYLVYINPQYMTNPTIDFPVKMKYIWVKFSISGLKMKTDLESGSKFLHAIAIFYYIFPLIVNA